MLPAAAARRLATALALVTVLASCGGASGSSSGTTATTRRAAATSTASTTTSTSTTASSSTTTTPPTTIPADAVVINADGAVLQPVPPGTPSVPFPAEADCETLGAPGWLVDCGEGTAGPTEVLWLIEELPTAPSSLRVTIFTTDGATATPVLQAFDGDRSSFADVHVESADVDDTPGDELLVGFRAQGSGGFLQLDVVSGSGALLAHRTLDQGRAQVVGDVVRTWAAQYTADDPNCCPSAFLQEDLVGRAGEWKVFGPATVPTEQVPAGQFP